MCGCAFKSGNRGVLSNQGFSNIISSTEFISPKSRTYSDFMFYRCISEPKFKKALSTVSIEDTTLDKKINTNDDVKKLADWADSGDDVRNWNVSIKALLGSIKFDQKELDNAQCQIAFSND